MRKKNQVQQICGSCKGNGAIAKEAGSVHTRYADGTQIPNPQIVGIIAPEWCNACKGTGWIEGGSR